MACRIAAKGGIYSHSEVLIPAFCASPCNPVRAVSFALVNQVIMKLATAVDLATSGPDRVQQVSLAPAFPGLRIYRGLYPPG